jgi:hypothetical protein
MQAEKESVLLSCASLFHYSSLCPTASSLSVCSVFALFSFRTFTIHHPRCRRWDPITRKVRTLYVFRQRLHLHGADKGALSSSPREPSYAPSSTDSRSSETVRGLISLSFLILILPRRYVDSLETRLEKMEGMLSRVCRYSLRTLPASNLSSIQLYPDGDFSQEMELDGWARGFQTDSPGDQSSPQQVASSSRDTSPLHPPLPTPKVPGSYCDESGDSSDDSDTAKGDLRNRLQKLTITPNTRRYFGKSSGITLIRSALSAKSKASGGESPVTEPKTKRRLQRRDDFWVMRPVRFPPSIVLFLIDRP